MSNRRVKRSFGTARLRRFNKWFAAVGVFVLGFFLNLPTIVHDWDGFLSRVRQDVGFHAILAGWLQDLAGKFGLAFTLVLLVGVVLYGFRRPLLIWFAAVRDACVANAIYFGGWLDLNQSAARSAAPYYPIAVTEQPRLLHMNCREFARRTNLPHWVASYFLAHPHCIPRPDVLPQIAKGLLLKPEYFDVGGSLYDSKLAKARLIRYHELELVTATLYAQYIDARGNRIIAAVRRAETVLMEELPQELNDSEPENRKEALP